MSLSHSLLYMREVFGLWMLLIVFVSHDDRQRAEKWNGKGSTLFLLQVRVILFGVLVLWIV